MEPKRLRSAGKVLIVVVALMLGALVQGGQARAVVSTKYPEAVCSPERIQSTERLGAQIRLQL